jgi:hypothetical protein
MAHEAYRTTLAALREQLRLLDVQRQKVAVAIAAIEDLPAPPPIPGLFDKVQEPEPAREPEPEPPTRGDWPSYPEGAEIILREVGRPLHMDEILKRALLRGWYADKDLDDRVFKNAVTGSVDRKMRKGKVFNRPAPATYGLREWEKNDTPAPNGAGAGAPSHNEGR